MTVDIVKLGDKIKKLREGANLTQKHIADYLCVDQSLISKFEKGERFISSDKLGQLAALYCCSLPSLISDGPISSSYNIAFRTNEIREEDLSALSVINRIALNQAQMDMLAGGNEDGR